jgi:hypothetical protein
LLRGHHLLLLRGRLLAHPLLKSYISKFKGIVSCEEIFLGLQYQIRTL